MLPDQSNPRELSKAIKQQRLAHGYTQEELAEILGVTTHQVSNYEAFGRKNFVLPRPAVYNQLNRIFFNTFQPLDT